MKGIIMAITISDECIACGACEGTCPMGAISVADVAEVEDDSCVECGACLGACPVEAISL